MIFQRTIQKEISITGLGLHTGESVKLVLKPGEDNSGIIFCRKDLNPSPKAKVSAEFITDTTLCSTLEKGKLRIMTIEHLMSALHAYGIENIIINVYGPELPILDGSAIPYLYLIKSAGIKNLSSEKQFIMSMMVSLQCSNPLIALLLTFQFNFHILFLQREIMKLH